MSQFAREYPEDYEERLDAMLDAADNLRKALKERHLGDPAYDQLNTTQAILRQEERDRESDEMMRGFRD